MSEPARTVVPLRARVDENALLRLAGPAFDLAGMAASARAGEERRLLAEAEARLQAFATAAAGIGLPRAALAPARLALGVLIDQTARANRTIDIRTWAAGAHRSLFDGRDLAPGAVREFHRVAEREGAAYAPLRRLLDEILTRIDGLARAPRPPRRRSALLALATVAVLLFGLVGYVGVAEYRYQARLFAAFEAEAQTLLGAAGESEAALAQRLDRLSAAAARTETAAVEGPLGGLGPLGRFESGHRARAAYLAAVAAAVPPALARGVEMALATEGTDLELYDDVRARAILDGHADWSASYLAGWLEDRRDRFPDLALIAPHVAALPGAPKGLPPPDAELLEQARGFAAESSEADRAWLELRRSAEAAALAPWRPDAEVPELSDVLVRRSGLPIDSPVPGLFTPAGWDWARDYGAGLAVRAARANAADLLGRDLPQTNDAPDRVMDRLQLETIAHWQDFLADLRVRPFVERETALLVSGALAARRSPLEDLLRATWIAAGGADRRRSHAQQLSLATSFGPTIQYVEQGGMDQITSLFAALNAALGAADFDREAGARSLTSVQDRARSVSALRVAPLIVVRIVEDVLAQTSASRGDDLSNPLVRAWQTGVLPVCRGTLTGRYPFADGPDSDPAAVAALLAPGGALDRFFRANVQRLLDTEASPWRWKPEARFAGLSPESAPFFERAMALSTALFAPDGRLGADLSLSALAERGLAVIAIGGVGGPVRAGAAPETLTWPGPEPARGVEVTFQAGGSTESLAEPGPWGLLRLLDRLRLRPRDDGRRYLVDMRTETGRIFVEMGFSQAANPLSARPMLAGFDCPEAL